MTVYAGRMDIQREERKEGRKEESIGKSRREEHVIGAYCGLTEEEKAEDSSRKYKIERIKKKIIV